ncbi:hypothetical protein ON010_g3494 [Phytophthora cinnamomi]|nr:hypothetical protein ON010_g3494 [Phytophthora cinnamomi]
MSAPKETTSKAIERKISIDQCYEREKMKYGDVDDEDIEDEKCNGKFGYCLTLVLLTPMATLKWATTMSGPHKPKDPIGRKQHLTTNQRRAY